DHTGRVHGLTKRDTKTLSSPLSVPTVGKASMRSNTSWLQSFMSWLNVVVGRCGVALQEHKHVVALGHEFTHASDMISRGRSAPPSPVARMMNATLAKTRSSTAAKSSLLVG